jgi:hypothetical protein
MKIHSLPPKPAFASPRAEAFQSDTPGTCGRNGWRTTHRWAKLLGLAAGALLATVTGTRAGVIAYEPFNYASIANNTPSTGTGFTGNWACGGAGTVATGLTYPNLPVANSALQSGSSRQAETFATSLSSGTKYISFLFKASGNMGGNIDGVYFPNGNSTCLWFGFGLGPYSGTQGQLGLGSTTTAGTSAQGATSLKQVGLGTYGNVYLIVLQIDFDTSGANDTVSVYTNCPANASSPGATLAGSVATFDVGTITGVGLNVQGGANITVDEIRVGETYGDVVGYAPPPPAPANVVATAGVNSVSLTWDAAAGATGYNVLRGTASGVYTVTNRVSATSFVDSTAVGGTPYYYVVQGTNTSGAGASSLEVTATPSIALPDVPTGLTATGTNGAVILAWNTATGAASYNLKRATTSGAEVTIANVAGTAYTDSTVVNGTPYFYTVSSTNSAGESANSGEVTATPNSPPPVPTAVSATAGTNQVLVSWTGSIGAASYNVKRSTTSGSGYVTIGTTTEPTWTYTDTSAVKFTQYYYVVSAVSGYGESADSSPEATATPTGTYGPTAYESFNYPIGTLANNTPSTAAGFTGNWTVAAFPTIVAGLSYSNLPTAANAYQHGAAGSQTYENFATPLSSGTKYISYLFKGSGNSGGDTVGVFFKGNNATSLFAGFHVPDSAVTTGFSLGSVNSTSLGAASTLGGIVNINNTAVHFIVLKIDFNTSGANDTVSLWIDPPAGVSAPGVPPNATVSSFDVGVISAFGINITGGYSPQIDELRTGDVYGDVAGYGTLPPATIPTTLALSVSQGEQISWTAYSTNTYQAQKSYDNTTWTNVGALFSGNTVTSLYEASPAPYYRVLEYIPGGPGPDVMVNGSFEITAANNIGAANWNGPASTGLVNQYVTNAFDGLLPTEGVEMLLLEGQGGSGSLVESDLFPITGGLTYKVVFDAANPMKSGGGNPQYRVQFFDANNAFISDSSFISIASAGASWITVSNNFATPANAAKIHIDFLQAVGAGPADHWITLVDYIRVSALATIGGENILVPTIQLGAMFTGTVKTNGVTATVASGTIRFSTNSTALSENTLAAGIATSATAILTPPYTVTAVYSGDANYIGSTNTLAVTNASAIVTLEDLSQTYNGEARSVTAVTTPSGLTVTLTYDGAADAPTNAGTYQVVGTVVDPLFAGSATNSLVVSKAAATVTLGNLSQTYDGTPKSVTVTTAPSGLTVDVTYDGAATVPVNIGNYQVIGTIVDPNYEGGATNTLTITNGNHFGTDPGTVSFNGSTASVALSGIEGSTYSIVRATNLAFTEGVKTFPPTVAPAGGMVSITDDFSDLGAVPAAAYYRMLWVP